MDPPIDNADPLEEANETLKGDLRCLASEDWEAPFPLLRRPGNRFIRRVAKAALIRILEFEQPCYSSSHAIPPGHVGSYIQEELNARGWTVGDCAERMGGDVALNECVLDLLLSAADKQIRLGEETAAGLETAFGVKKQTWLNLDEAWRNSS